MKVYPLLLVAGKSSLQSSGSTTGYASERRQDIILVTQTHIADFEKYPNRSSRPRAAEKQTEG